MHVTSSILAAGLAAFAMAAPGARPLHRRVSCSGAGAAVATNGSSAAPGAAATGAGAASSGSNSSAAGGGLKFLGTSESGAEFGEKNWPGVYGKDYIFPDTSTIQTLIDMGMNMFRIPFLAG
jgi:endoglucanase